MIHVLRVCYIAKKLFKLSNQFVKGRDFLCADEGMAA